MKMHHPSALLPPGVMHFPLKAVQVEIHSAQTLLTFSLEN